MLQYNNNAIDIDRKLIKKSEHIRHVPKLVQVQFAQYLNNLLEYSSELTYFAINAFQTSSLRRVQINTLQRFSNFCVPRTCAFYYNLDTEFDSFVQKMRLLCALTKRTFVDMRLARIHYPNGRMMNLPIIRRSLDVFKCNINRLRDLKQIHQDIGHDLLLPNDQLYLALDLLITDFELLNCELDSQIKFNDAMVLQTIAKDVFLQYRIVLTWIYPAVKSAAYRPGDPDTQHEIKKCDETCLNHQINDCSNKSRKVNEINNVQSIDDHVTRLAENMNKNCVTETVNDSSVKYPKKRTKSSRKTAIAMNDFNEYLNDKKLQKMGILHLKNHEVNINTNKFYEFNRIIQDMKKNIDKNVYR